VSRFGKSGGGVGFSRFRLPQHIADKTVDPQKRFADKSTTKPDNKGKVLTNTPTFVYTPP
jgi:hypothetical protein